MKHEKSVLSKTIMTVGLPVVLTFIVMAGISMGVVSQSFEQFSEIQNTLLLIYAIGLVVIVGAIYFGTKAMSSRITKLAEDVSRFAEGDVDSVFKQDRSHDQLGEVVYGLAGIAESIKTQADAAQKLAEGDLSVEINPVSERDLMGNSLLAIQKSVSNALDYLMMLPDLVEKDAGFPKNQEKLISGNYQKAINQVITAMETLADKRDFFKTILDAMPYRITVVDTDLKWTFINKTLQDLRAATGREGEREDIYGQDCCNSNLDMCKNEDCGVKAY